MGLRFRRTLRLLPGVRVNLSKSGASLSLGGRGATVNLSSRGVRRTVGLPGTGLSYSDFRRYASKKPRAAPRPRSRTASVLCAACGRELGTNPTCRRCLPVERPGKNFQRGVVATLVLAASCAGCLVCTKLAADAGTEATTSPKVAAPVASAPAPPAVRPPEPRRR